MMVVHVCPWGGVCCCIVSFADSGRRSARACCGDVDEAAGARARRFRGGRHRYLSDARGRGTAARCGVREGEAEGGVPTCWRSFRPCTCVCHAATLCRGAAKPKRWALAVACTVLPGKGNVTERLSSVCVRARPTTTKQRTLWERSAGCSKSTTAASGKRMWTLPSAKCCGEDRAA